MSKFMNRLLALFATLLMTGTGWAADFTSGTAVANHTDLSVGYLGQIFGSVGNVLQGSSGQMLGQLFYKLNEGIIIVAGLWLSYTIFTIVLRSAQEGSFMGANKNIALIFLKIAVGFGLLIPNPSTGYSLLQDLVMQVVVQGVGLADQTWQYGLTYVQNGGSVWHRPAESGSKSDVINTKTATSILGGSTENKTGAGQQIFANEVCMYSSTDNQTQISQNNANNTGVAISGTSPVVYDVVMDDQAHKFEFPGIGDAAPNPGAEKCGSVSWNIQGACTGPLSSATKCTMAKQALSELVMGLQPAAKKYYCSQHAAAPSCIGVSTDNVANDNAQYFFSSLVNYVNIMVPLVQLNTGGAKSQKSFIQEAINEGWLSAGRYYWDMAQVASAYDNISNIGNYAPSDPKPPTLSGNPLTDANNALSESYGYINPVLHIVNQYAQTQNAGDTGSGFDASGGNGGIPLASKILMGVATDITSLIDTFKTGTGGAMGPDPILFLHRIGMACIGIAGDIWFSWLGALAIIFFSTAAGQMFYNATGAFQNVLDWIKPLLMIIAGAFWAAGFVLGFYVPMYPYIIYIFGIIGWIIAVIEAMVAAPLICFGLTHPEGHDFLGEAKQAMMLLLGIFLRPALMVIGLIAAMILSYVSLRILVYTFAGFTKDLFSTAVAGASNGSILGSAASLLHHAAADSTGLSGYVLSLLVFPLTLIIFVTLVYTVTTQCFSLIYALPDNILRWIGGPQHPSHASEMARQVQSTLGGATDAIGQGQRAGLTNMRDKQERRDELAKTSQVVAGNAEEK